MLITEDILKKIESVEVDANSLIEIADKVVASYTDDLDSIMKGINENIIGIDNPPVNVIEKYFLELSNAIYFVSARVEKVGIYDGVSKAAAQAAYNKSYTAKQTKDFCESKKSTIADLTVYAQNNSIYENMVNELYSRVYKTIRSKIETAQTMVATLSKVISKRMSENQFSNVNNNSRRILNEEVMDASTPF